MSRKVLVIGGIVVLAAAIALIVWSRQNDTASAAGSSRSPGSAVVIAPSSSPSTPTVAPSLPGTQEPAQGSAREYVVGDMRVRDHRAGDQAPLQIPPNVHPPEGRELPSILTHDISQKVKQVMMSCAADLPKDARGASPRLQGQIIVAIKDGTLSVAKSTILLTDVVGDAAEPVRSCIEQKAVGLATPAAGEADLDSYSINLTFAIP